MKRNLFDIISQLLLVIPINNDSLISGLRSIQDSCAFAAPEMQSFWWREAAYILSEYANANPNAGWIPEASKIFIGNEQ